MYGGTALDAFEEVAGLCGDPAGGMVARRMVELQAVKADHLQGLDRKRRPQGWGSGDPALRPRFQHHRALHREARPLDSASRHGITALGACSPVRAPSPPPCWRRPGQVLII